MTEYYHHGVSYLYTKGTTWPYCLTKGYQAILDAEPADHIFTEQLQYMKGGFLAIGKDYAWDGPSGPIVDTLTNIRASLVHDALYQLIRLKLLPMSFRKNADKELYRIMIEDGASHFRALYYYYAVRAFGKKYAKKLTPKDKQT